MGAELPWVSSAEAARLSKKDPEGICGRRVSKDFDGKPYNGSVTEFHKVTGYRVRFDDHTTNNPQEEDFGILAIREML